MILFPSSHTQFVFNFLSWIFIILFSTFPWLFSYYEEIFISALALTSFLDGKILKVYRYAFFIFIFYADLTKFLELIKNLEFIEMHKDRP